MDWPTLEAWLETAGGDGASLAQAADLSALAAAIEAPVAETAVLLQAQLRGQPYGSAYLVEIAVGDSGSSELRSTVEEYMTGQVDSSGMPPYRAVDVADQQDGATAIEIIALVYTDRADADEAAEAVPVAVASGLTFRGRLFADLLPYEVTSDIIEDAINDRYVARTIFIDTSPDDAAEPPNFTDGPFRELVRLVDTGDIADLLATVNLSGRSSHRRWPAPSRLLRRIGLRNGDGWRCIGEDQVGLEGTRRTVKQTAGLGELSCVFIQDLKGAGPDDPRKTAVGGMVRLGVGEHVVRHLRQNGVFNDIDFRFLVPPVNPDGVDAVDQVAELDIDVFAFLDLDRAEAVDCRSIMRLIGHPDGAGQRGCGNDFVGIGTDHGQSKDGDGGKQGREDLAH